jgi:hypothetical protein
VDEGREGEEGDDGGEQAEARDHGEEEAQKKGRRQAGERAISGRGRRARRRLSQIQRNDGGGGVIVHGGSARRTAPETKPNEEWGQGGEGGGQTRREGRGRRGLFEFAITLSLICRKAGACLQAIQLVEIARERAPTYRGNRMAKANGNQPASIALS